MSLELVWFIGHALAAALCFSAGVHFARWRFVVAALKLRHERAHLRARRAWSTWTDDDRANEASAWKTLL